jgi:hypothetical protein
MSEKIKPEAHEGPEASNVISFVEWRRKLSVGRNVPSEELDASATSYKSARESFAEFEKRLGEMTKEEIAAYVFNVLM